MFGIEKAQLINKVSGLEESLKTEKKFHSESIEKLERQITRLKEDHEIAMARKTDQVDLSIQKATKELNKTIQELTIAKNKAEKEAEILTKAFENLGFDVKDMKDILNKLVDGIVSKNTIQLVK